MRNTGLVVVAVALAGCGYAKKSKKSEAEVHLERLGEAAKTAFASKQAFPKGSAALTPGVPCCMAEGADHKCKPSPKDWAAPAWQALGFDITESHYYQYSYESDGATFTAQAVGDLDCDNIMATYELKGKIVAGEAELTLTTPPPGAD